MIEAGLRKAFDNADWQGKDLLRKAVVCYKSVAPLHLYKFDLLKRVEQLTRISENLCDCLKRIESSQAVKNSLEQVARLIKDSPE